MTFEEAERSDSPQPSWISKDGGDELASEIQTVTTDSVIQRTRSIYDSVTEKITNEIARGLCAICGKPLSENNVVLCHYGDLVCNACMIFYNGRSICRKHTEFYIGSKPEAIVLISVAFGLNKNDIKQISRLSENSIVIAKNMLVNRGYIKIKSLGLIGNSTKITESGIEIIEILVTAYKADLDFRIFLKRLGWDSNVETESGQK